MDAPATESPKAGNPSSTKAGGGAGGDAQAPAPATSATNATANAAAAEPEKEGKKKERKSFKGRRKGKPGKIHIRLPGPEAYRKEICFPAEAPGRVVVRLERLMGSDKIKPVDGKYMETLIQRLEEEEKLAWNRKIRLRKKAETERHRQLAIKGLMEPGPGMEDLYNHPVFRVNRIFNRLSKLDHTFFDHRSLRMPPIQQIDPFEKDNTGAYFKEYPFHKQLKENWSKYRATSAVALRGELEEPLEEGADVEEEGGEGEGEEHGRTPLESKGTLQLQLSQKPSKASAKPSKKATQLKVEGDAEPTSPAPEGDEGDEEEQPEAPEMSGAASSALLEDEEGQPKRSDRLREELEAEFNQSLDELMEKYGCPKTPNFEEYWKPYRDSLLEKFYNDYNSSEEIYEAGKDLFDLYTRQDIVTREHIDAGHTAFVYPGETVSNLGIDEDASEMDEEEEDDEEEEGDEEEEEEEDGEEDEEGAEPSESVPELSAGGKSTTAAAEGEGAEEEAKTEEPAAEAEPAAEPAAEVEPAAGEE